MKSKMPTKGKAKASSADNLVKTRRKGHVELDEKELKRVTGGTTTSYKPQKADGSLDAGIHFKYDLKAQKES
jgi:hypothetical protein